MDSFSHRKRKFFFAWCVELSLESKLLLAYSERGERNGSQLLPSSPVLLPQSNGLILVEDDRMCNTFAMTSSPGGGSTFLGLTSSSSDGAAARGASFSMSGARLFRKKGLTTMICNKNMNMYNLVFRMVFLIHILFLCTGSTKNCIQVAPPPKNVGRLIYSYDPT